MTRNRTLIDGVIFSWSIVVFLYAVLFLLDGDSSPLNVAQRYFPLAFAALAFRIRGTPIEWAALWLSGRSEEEKLLLGAAGVVSVFMAFSLGHRSRRKAFSGGRQKAKCNPLDWPVMEWEPGEPFSIRNLLQSVAIFGATGSGKTSGSSKAILRSLIRLGRHVGGVIFGAKPEDLHETQELFRAGGRLEDLRVFSPESGSTCNYMDFIVKLGGHDAREVAKFLSVIKESVQTGAAKGGGGEMGDFWATAQEEQLFNAVVPVLLAEGEVRPDLLRDFILGAAREPAQLDDPKWRDGGHNTVLRKAHRAAKRRTDMLDLEGATKYWTRQYPNLAEKTRSCIDAGVLSLLNTYCRGTVRQMIAEKTNFSPVETLLGRWIFCDMSPAAYGDGGIIVNTGLKYVCQRMLLRRGFTPGDAIHVLFMDEAPQFINSGFDSQYLAQCRSHGGCMVCISQSLPSYYSVLKGENGKHHANALLANFGTKLFHSLGDIETATWAVNFIGKELTPFIGGSSQANDDFVGQLFGTTQQTTSYSTQFEYVLQPNVFLNGGLRTGGPANQLMTDAVLIRSEPFQDGRNWKLVTFSQR